MDNEEHEIRERSLGTGKDTNFIEQLQLLHSSLTINPLIHTNIPSYSQIANNSS
jgi:hypothetical protein